jgi:hypothetical protein
LSISVVNIKQDTLVVDVKQSQPTVNVQSYDLTLDIASGGIVPAAIDTTLVASTSLSALRCITTDGSGLAKYATPDSLANAVVIGISTTAANTGENITIKTSGQITDASWNWTKGAIYLGTNGVLTQTAPTGGSIVVHVAKAITATTLIIDIDTIIQTV